MSGVWGVEVRCVGCGSLSPPPLHSWCFGGGASPHTIPQSAMTPLYSCSTPSDTQPVMEASPENFGRWCCTISCGVLRPHILWSAVGCPPAAGGVDHMDGSIYIYLQSSLIRHLMKRHLLAPHFIHHILPSHKHKHTASISEKRELKSLANVLIFIFL